MASFAPSQTLYSFTVFCTVYLLRRSGVKLPRQDVLAVPFHGWLYFGKDTRNFEGQGRHSGLTVEIRLLAPAEN
ncbi:hypothetical protein BH11PSE13_BH11PSE13_45070 [soil metagenome]